MIGKYTTTCCGLILYRTVVDPATVSHPNDTTFEARGPCCTAQARQSAAEARGLSTGTLDALNSAVKAENYGWMRHFCALAKQVCSQHLQTTTHQGSPRCHPTVGPLCYQPPHTFCSLHGTPLYVKQLATWMQISAVDKKGIVRSKTGLASGASGWT